MHSTLVQQLSSNTYSWRTERYDGSSRVWPQFTDLVFEQQGSSYVLIYSTYVCTSGLPCTAAGTDTYPYERLDSALSNSAIPGWSLTEAHTRRMQPLQLHKSDRMHVPNHVSHTYSRLHMHTRVAMCRRMPIGLCRSLRHLCRRSAERIRITFGLGRHFSDCTEQFAYQRSAGSATWAVAPRLSITGVGVWYMNGYAESAQPATFEPDLRAFVADQSAACAVRRPGHRCPVAPRRMHSHPLQRCPGISI